MFVVYGSGVEQESSGRLCRPSRLDEMSWENKIVRCVITWGYIIGVLQNGA